MLSKDNGYMPAIILTLVVLVTTGLLAMTNGLTQAARDEQAVAAANASRTLICPNAATFEPFAIDAALKESSGVNEIFIIRDVNQAVMGLLYTSASRGYAGDVPVLVAIDMNNAIIRALPLDNDETPGLGKKISGDSFIGQYTGLVASAIYTVKPNETDKVLLDAIAGATISSNAVTQAVNQATALHQQLASEVK